MVIQIARRSFLFGVGAAVAAELVCAPTAIAASSPGVSRMRKYVSFDFLPSASPIGIDPWALPASATFTISITPSKEPMFCALVGSDGLHWKSRCGIIVPAGCCLMVDCEGTYGIAEAALVFEDEDGLAYFERHTFPSSGLGTIIPLEAALA